MNRTRLAESKRSLSFVAAACAVVVSGCGPKVTSSLGPNGTLPTSVAVLPPDYSADIPRERIDYITAAVGSELRNSRFIVVDDRVVRDVCSTPACPERAVLSEKYLVDGIVSLKLESLSRNNFLAGYYNALSGKLTVADTKGKDLVTVDHTESERGGLLFQTGQVFQGIIEQVKNSGDSAFENLANKFAKTIVEQLPMGSTAPSDARQEGSELAINSTRAEWSASKEAASLLVCAKGTPSSFAFLLLGGNKTALKEVRPGEYCGALSPLVAFNTPGPFPVELRSAFGNSVRMAVDLPVLPLCGLDNRVNLEQAKASQVVTVKCSRIGKESGVNQIGCSETLPQCSADKVLVFQAPTEAGPFTKVTELDSSHGSVPAGQSNLQLIAIARGGATSLPLSLPITKP